MKEDRMPSLKTKAASLMFQGTGSDVGKSLLVAGLCRYYYNQGYRVAPFKPQNMSNNAAVTEDGGEIGRAQALQALACGRKASLDMNPVLLKPQSDIGSQVILQGQRLASLTAKEYHQKRIQFLPAVLESYQRLCQQNDIVLIEGAGSPAEINLRKGDIANMGFASAAQTPVILIGDIERGGVIASLAGTYHLLPSSEKALLRGTIINKFRGDISLFDQGRQHVVDYTQTPCLGVIPYFDSAKDLPAEDSVTLAQGLQNGPSPRLKNTEMSHKKIQISVLHFPHIANFDDLDPLRLEEAVEITLLPPGTPIPGDCDLVILPGSKTTLADLQVVRLCGWEIDLKAHRRRGGWILGICGGYQMLGKHVSDSEGIEGLPSQQPGLGFVDLETHMTSKKTLTPVTATEIMTGVCVQGYEMHIGRTHGKDQSSPWFRLPNQISEGVSIENGQISGTYLHGLFQNDAFRHHYLQRLSHERHGAALLSSTLSYQPHILNVLDKLAEHLAQYIDMETLARSFSQKI